jgi:hypothetical protein
MIRTLTYRSILQLSKERLRNHQKEMMVIIRTMTKRRDDNAGNCYEIPAAR